MILVGMLLRDGMTGLNSSGLKISEIQFKTTTNQSSLISIIAQCQDRAELR